MIDSDADNDSLDDENENNEIDEGPFELTDTHRIAIRFIRMMKFATGGLSRLIPTLLIRS